MFKDGDVVCLKSGGARMTVQTGVLAEDQDLVAVVWCDAADVPHREYFHPAMLVKADTELPSRPFILRHGRKITGLEMLQFPNLKRFHDENLTEFSIQGISGAVYNGPDTVIQ